MIWFFERQHARLRYEIRRQSDGPGYEIAITHPDGRQVAEQYGSASDLAARATALQDALIAEGWQSPRVRSPRGASMRPDDSVARDRAQPGAPGVCGADVEISSRS